MRFCFLKFTWSIALSFFIFLGQAQVYDDYFGNGHTIGVKVTSSSNETNDTSTYTIIGSNITPDLVGASRFLSQATLGADYEEIERVSQIGINAWIDEQVDLPFISYYETYRDIFDTVVINMAIVHGAAEVDSTRRRDYINFAFYQKLFTEPNALRHRVALALSQILVTSINDNNLDDRGFAMSSYYDILYKGAFGNFQNLLNEITCHPAMGIYLSHFKNKKANPIAGTLPDENFAREVMQLFTIGLYELNNDGTCKKDSIGNFIATYDIEDIQELSKVFTGLSGSAWDTLNRPDRAGTPVTFNKGFSNYDLTQPMAMYEEHHDTTSKVMIDGSSLPSGKMGMEDINDALNILFNHNNVGPFIATRLIQQLIKSNPTPAYVNRIAMIFNDNGSGVRGDLKEIIKAILLDPEAINCEWIDDVKGGKLIQPLERFTNLFIGFDIASPSGKFWFRDFVELYSKVEQSFYAAPSVFNFFSPFYAEDKNVAANNMVSPEFQILHSTSGIHYINLIENAIKIRPFRNRTAINLSSPRLTNNNDDEPFLDFSDEMTLYDNQGVVAMLDRINLIMCRGQLTDTMKTEIGNAITSFDNNSGSYASENAIEDALYFIMMSPNYMIKK